MEFNSYKITDVLKHTYYEVPQKLFEIPIYKNKLNSNSKLLYAFLLDRLKLSQKNNWCDEEKNVYLIFTRKEVEEKLNLNEKTVTKSFKQLREVNLIKEKKQGMGKPNLIYIGKVKDVEIQEKSDNLKTNFKNSKIYGY